jgi:hypothetical protein
VAVVGGVLCGSRGMGGPVRESLRGLAQGEKGEWAQG